MDFKKRIIIEKIAEFAKRNAVWLLLGLFAYILLKPGMPEMNTLLLLVLIESVAIALSGIAAYAYTKLDFTRLQMWNTLGSIFLGVHISIGLVVLGVYFTQI